MKPKKQKINVIKANPSTVSPNEQLATRNVSVNLLANILLIAYGYITVMTPNWMAFDSNAPKFLTFAILNLITAGFVLFVKDFRANNNALFSFFLNKIGITYCIIILLSVASFAKVINVEEAILHFFKFFTAFSGAWLVSCLVIYNPKNVIYLSIAMIFLLFFDCLKTFEGVSKIIKGLGSDYDIKGSYSNKNILTSAIFIKIPFAIWLFYFQKDWKRILGGIGIVVGSLSVFFMSSRAFYLAIFIILFVLIIYSLLNYFLLKRKSTGIRVGSHILLVVLAFGIFSFVQGVMYPKAVKESTSFTARLSTIAQEENISNNLRKTAWTTSVTEMIPNDPLLGVGIGNWKIRYLEHENSYSPHYIYWTTSVTEMIPNDPLLGVGIGNWKIRYLEHENSYSPHYIYMYKAHNDFIEIASEIGIFGGLSFVAIFVLIGLYFLKATYQTKNKEHEKWLLLPLLGLFSYAFDAFFNFPQDRPEIQSLFALYVGIAVALTSVYFSKKEISLSTKNSSMLIALVAIVALSSNFANVVVQKMYFESSKIQRMVKEEQQGIRKTKSNSAYLLQNYPKIPNLTAVAEPVDVEKARYLIDEKKFKEAREVLSSIKYHPWDGRPEYFIAVSYFMDENKNFDSIYKYAHKARKVKPNFFGNTNLETFALNNMGREKESIELWKTFLGLTSDSIKKEIPKWKSILKNTLHVDVDKDAIKANRKEPQAWNALAYLQEKNNLIEQAKATLDTAFVYLPEDKSIADNRNKITSRVQMQEFAPLFSEAFQKYQQLHYEEAVARFTAFLEKVPTHTDAIGYRAVSYYHLKQYQKAIADMSRIEELGATPSPVLNNFRASCHYMLGEKTKAKIYFEKAAKEGNQDAQKNLQNLTF